jgi:hypothetical protein
MTPTNDPSQMLRNAGLALGFAAFAVLGAYWLFALAHAKPIFQRPDVKATRLTPSALVVAKDRSLVPYTGYKLGSNSAQPAAQTHPLPPTASPVAKSIHESVPTPPSTPRDPAQPTPPRPEQVPPKGYESTPPQPRSDQRPDVHPEPGPGPASFM